MAVRSRSSVATDAGGAMLLSVALEIRSTSTGVRLMLRLGGSPLLKRSLLALVVLVTTGAVGWFTSTLGRVL